MKQSHPSNAFVFLSHKTYSIIIKVFNIENTIKSSENSGISSYVTYQVEKNASCTRYNVECNAMHPKPAIKLVSHI